LLGIIVAVAGSVPVATALQRPDPPDLGPRPIWFGICRALQGIDEAGMASSFVLRTFATAVLDESVRRAQRVPGVVPIGRSLSREVRLRRDG